MLVFYNYASGQVKHRLSSRWSMAVALYNRKIFSAEYDSDQRQHCIYEYCCRNEAQWTGRKVVSLGKNDWTTFVIRDNKLTCSMKATNEMRVYSLRGELLQTHRVAGGRGRGAGQLRAPYVTGQDDEGSVLIADHSSNRLQVMSARGEFSVLQLEPQVSRPVGAVLWNSALYVSSAGELTIAKFLPPV